MGTSIYSDFVENTNEVSMVSDSQKVKSGN